MNREAKASRRPLDPDPELWEALGHGEKLAEALEGFYDEVFGDPLLSRFFRDVTKSWVREKQFAFLRSILLGDSSYFGYRPRNAHHWMVISDALFDHREEMLMRHLRRVGLAEEHVLRVRTIDECFRKQIVKDAPRPRRLGGRALPIDGWEPLSLDDGGLCDACGDVVDRGATVDVHVRTGKVRCATCRSVATHGEGAVGT